MGRENHPDVLFVFNDLKSDQGRDLRIRVFRRAYEDEKLFKKLVEQCTLITKKNADAVVPLRAFGEGGGKMPINKGTNKRGGRFNEEQVTRTAAEKLGKLCVGWLATQGNSPTRMGRKLRHHDHSTRHVISVLYHVIVMLSSNARKKYINFLSS